jgi:hypothetical protein
VVVLEDSPVLVATLVVMEEMMVRRSRRWIKPSLFLTVISAFLPLLPKSSASVVTIHERSVTIDCEARLQDSEVIFYGVSHKMSLIEIVSDGKAVGRVCFLEVFSSAA